MGIQNSFSPLGDGTSGASGNSASTATPGLANRHRGPELRQQHGNLRNPQSVAKGGPTLMLDPPTDRGGEIGTTADPNQRRPFKLGSSSASSPSQEPEPSTDESTDMVGGVPGENFDGSPDV
jgi:hypothetical protein